MKHMLIDYLAYKIRKAREEKEAEERAEKELWERVASLNYKKKTKVSLSLST